MWRAQSAVGKACFPFSELSRLPSLKGWCAWIPGHDVIRALHECGVYAQFVSEASATLKRRAEGTAEDVWLKSNLYPDYYLNTFHFQVIWVDLPANCAVFCTVPYFISALFRERACTAHR